MAFSDAKLPAVDLTALNPAGAQLELPISTPYGELLAEFFLDSRFVPYIYHYTLTRPDQPEILHWGQEYSEQAAHSSAKLAAEDYNSNAGFRPSRFNPPGILPKT